MHHAGHGGITALPGQAVTGADAVADLQWVDSRLYAAIAERFKCVAAGPVLRWAMPRAQRA